MRSTRKVRKTNDLLCFDSPTKENVRPENNIQNRRSLSSITLQQFEDNTRKSVDKKNVKMMRKQSILTHSNCVTHEKDNVCSEVLEFEINKSEKSLADDNMKKRKIIKAKRLLKSVQLDRKIEHEQPESHSDSKQDCIILKSKKLHSNGSTGHSENKSFVTADHSTLTQNTVQSKSYVDTTLGTYSNFANEKEKSSSTLNVVMKSFLSPVSPSLSSTDNLSPPQLEHLHFNSSQEQLYPSTSGIVDSSSRRRTFELENSITNISVLKSVSERDSFRMNSFVGDPDSGHCMEKDSFKQSSFVGDPESGQCKTPTDQKYSRVTMRRKWDKVNTFSPFDDGPAWSISSVKSSSKKTTLKTPNLWEKALARDHKTSSSTKKFVSKIRVPNFAAIHEKALNKIESIAEYKERKEGRAKMLLSGMKPTITSSSKKNVTLSQKKVTPIKKVSRKHLRFAPNTSLKEKSPTFIALPSTPLPKHLMQKTETLAVIQPFRFGSEKAESPQITNKSKDFAPLLRQKTFEKKIFTLKNKEHVHNTFALQASTKQKLDVVRMNVKSIVTKTKPATNMLESRRCAIKGVRSNRRFELLMNMRKGK